MENSTRTIVLIVAGVLAFYLFWPSSEEPRPKPVEEEYAVEEEGVDEPEVEEEETSESEEVVIKQKSIEKSVPKTSQSPQAKYPNLDESFIPFDEEGNRYITQIIQVGKHLVYHGDVLLGKSQDLPRIKKQGYVKKGKAPKWYGGKIPYVIDDNVVQADKVVEAIEYLNTFTNVKIVPREDEKDYVLVRRAESDCYAYAGKIGGMQEIYLVPQCGVREILHEWMHTLGFFHEQNREDRDDYLTVNWDNIHENNRPQFKKLPNDFIGLVGRPFDFQSIMLYHSFTFSLDPNEPGIKPLPSYASIQPITRGSEFMGVRQGDMASKDPGKEREKHHKHQSEGRDPEAI